MRFVSTLSVSNRTHPLLSRLGRGLLPLWLTASDTRRNSSAQESPAGALLSFSLRSSTTFVDMNNGIRPANGMIRQETALPASPPGRPNPAVYSIYGRLARRTGDRGAGECAIASAGNGGRQVKQRGERPASRGNCRI